MLAAFASFVVSAPTPAAMIETFAPADECSSQISGMQCGGPGYTGLTCCAIGYFCNMSNPYWFGCKEGNAPPPPPSPPSPPPAPPRPPPFPPTAKTYVLPAVPGTYTCNDNIPCGSAAGTPKNPFHGSTGDGGPSYACMDWSAGSRMWETQQAAYKARGGADVVFAVGSYGSGSGNLGKCFMLSSDKVSKPVLAQIINTGGDVAEGHFDLQQMAGGVGLCNSIAPSGLFPDGKASSDSAAPLFAGQSINDGTWGKKRDGGFTDSSGCDSIPQYPDGPDSDNGAAMRAAGEKGLQAMCHEAFTLGLRNDAGTNPAVSEVRHVPCPSEIFEITFARRSDEPTDNECSDTTPQKCPKIATTGTITRMFDACKPSAAWKSNVPTADSKYSQVIACGPDGITRLNAKHM